MTCRRIDGVRVKYYGDYRLHRECGMCAGTRKREGVHFRLTIDQPKPVGGLETAAWRKPSHCLGTVPLKPSLNHS